MTRRGRAFATAAVTLAVVAAVVIAATLAEGRTASETDTHDGGAWLLNREAGAIGHVDRRAQELTGAIRIADPRTGFDVDQARGVVLVHDQGTATATLIDGRTYSPSTSLDVPDDLTLLAVEGGMLAIGGDPVSVRRVSIAQLSELESLGDASPTLLGDGHGLAIVDRAHRAVLADATGTVLAEDGEGEVLRVELEGISGRPGQLTVVGDHIVVLTEEGELRIVADDIKVFDPPDHLQAGDWTLQQPAEHGGSVTAITPDGEVLAVDLESGSLTAVAELSGGLPVPPIVHGGCTFTVVTQPATFTRLCGDTVTEVPLEVEGRSPAQLRLRLVNGWVWINDVDTGIAWVTDTEDELVRIDEWDVALGQRDGEIEDDLVVDGPADEQRENPDDAELIAHLDELDLDGPNEPPVARPVTAATREGRPVVVDVLANDTDPNGDVLLVEAVDNRSPSDAVVTITGDRSAVQVVPAVGFTGTVRFSYTVTDGRGGSDRAEVTVDVTPRDPARNRPPVAVTDVATVRAGESVTLNVLTNDYDPDGDALHLVDVVGEGVRIVHLPDGTVTLTPQPDQEGRLELEYTVADEYGATSIGRILLAVRLPGSNLPPIARNDVGQVLVGNRLLLDVLANDSDPDGDRLIVQSQPQLLHAPEGADPYVHLDARGRLDFEAEVPGTYILLYSISDGSLSDRALIRIEVHDRDENRPPVAVRDDVVVPVGQSRIVPVLRNDHDPDGDVVSIVDRSVVDGLIVEEIEGDRFRVTALPSAPPFSSFRYTISDGVNEPVSTIVGVVVVEEQSSPPPPVAVADEIEARAGQVTGVAVLDNDHDPSGGPLHVVGVTDPEEADAAISSDGQRVVLDIPSTTDRGFTVGYEVENEAGDRASSTIRVRIVPDDDPNRAPIAGTDVARTLEGRPVAVDVLANDRDPDGDPIHLEGIVQQPPNGSARQLEDGRIEYRPDVGFTGTDRFTYSIVDAGGLRAHGVVLVGVTPTWPENRPPQAQDDTAVAVAGGGPLPIDVLANDHDPDGDPLRVAEVGEARLGSAAVARDGRSVIYTPPESIDGGEVEVTFRYVVDDGRGGRDDAVVTVTVTDEWPELPPVAVDDRVGPVEAGERVKIDVLENDRIPAASRDGIEITVGAAGLEVEDDRVVLTAPERTSTYRYTITDAFGQSSSATITVVVLPNRPPVVEPLVVETAVGEPIDLDLTGQASDPDGDELFFACCEGTRGGTVRVTSPDARSLTVVFEPTADAGGAGGFSYVVDDQQGHQVAGSVTVEIVGGDEPPPSAEDGSVEVEAAGSRSVDLAALVSYEGRAADLRFALEGSEGPIKVELDGSTLLIRAAVDAAGARGRVAFSVVDQAGRSDTGSVVVEVIPSSEPLPEARTDTARTTQGEPVVVDVLANDLGVELRVVDAGGSQHVNAEVIDGGQAVRLSPHSGFFGTTSASYTIRDHFDDPSREVTGRIELTVIGRPDTPSAPSVDADSRTATLTWTPPASNGAPIERYEIEHDHGGAQSLGPSSTYTWTGLTNGTEYRFRVRAVNEAGEGEFSPWSSPVMPNEVPGRPSAPQVRYGDSELEITWEAPPNEGSPITSYVLEIGGARTGVQELPATGAQTQSYTWGGLANGSSYTFRVKAVNAADEGGGDFSGWSEPEHPLTRPSAPPRPVLDNGPNYLDVEWGRPDDGGDPIQEYEVQIDTGATVRVSGANTTSYRWGDLTNGVEHRFRVRAWNRDERGGEWSEYSEFGRACDVPDAPAPPSVTRGDRSVEVSWNAPAYNGCEITGYEVAHDGGAVRSTGGGTTSITFDGLTNGTEYRFRVRALNEQGEGAWSPESAAVTPAGPPTAPSITSVEASGIEELTIRWSQADPNGSPIVRYEYRLNGGPARDAGNTTSVVVSSGLSAGTQYCAQVRAVNDVDAGDWSGQVCAVAEGLPGTPGNLHVDERTTSSLRWRWNAPAFDGGTSITHYQVDRGSNGNNLINESGTSHTWSGLNPDTTYDVRVRACNRHGCGSWTPSVSGRTLAPPAPSVSISKGSNATGEPGCDVDSCRWIRTSITGMSPNQSFNLQCQERPQGGSWSTFWQNNYSPSHNGSYVGEHCYYGYPGNDVRVRITPSGGSTATSNVLRW